MRPGTKTRPKSGLSRQPRQRVLAGAAVLAVAGLGATYLQALRSPAAYASTACSVNSRTELISADDFVAALNAVNAGTCDEITFSQSTTVTLTSAGQLPVVDLENLTGAQHLTINGNDADLRGSNSPGIRGLEIHLGHDDELTITELNATSLNAKTATNPNGGSLSVFGERGSGKPQVTVSHGNFGGYDANKGGDFYFSYVNALVEYALFTNSQTNDVTSVGGGAIYALDSSVSIEKTMFRGTRAKVGAGIFIKNGDLTVDEGNFYRDLSRKAGAAIYADNADLLITNTNFQENSAAADSNLTGSAGGALYVKNGSAQIFFSSFVNNTALEGASGLAIAAPTDSVTMKGVLLGTTNSYPNCAVDSYATTVAYSVSDDASCSFETYDATNSKDGETAVVTDDMNATTGGDALQYWCGWPWVRSRMPKETSWAKVNGPSTNLGVAGVSEDIWGVPRSAPFTIGARQFTTPPTVTFPTTDIFPDGTTGVNYTSQTVTATNGPKIVYDIPRPWPDGLSFDGCTGSFRGRPTKAGSYTVTPKAYGPGGETSAVAQNFVIVQGPMAPVITAGPTTSGSIGTAYSSAFTATGYPTPTFNLFSGTVPPGLTLNSDGTVTGTPTVDGTYTFAAQAKNSAWSAPTPPITRSVTIVIGKIPPTFTRESATSPVTYGDAYDYAYGVTGTEPITFAKASGTLPPGLSLNTSTGRLSGTPTSPGTYTFTVSATNTAGTDTTVTQTVVVRPDLPEAPVVSAKAGDTVLNLTWPKQTDQGSSPITKYKVVATPGNKSCEVNATAAATYSCTLSGLRNGTTYVLKAQSFSTVGWSATRSTPGTPCTVPNMPRNITVESKTADGVVKLTWDEPSFDGGSRILGYVVFWRLRDDVKYVQMPSVTTLSRTITGLEPGKIYRIAVAARNGVGRSDTKTFKIVKVPRT